MKLTKLRLRTGVVAQILEGEMVLLDTLGGQYFDLNPSGTLILDRLLKGDSSDQTLGVVVERFLVDRPRAQQDLDLLVRQLLDAGLIETQ